MGWQVSIGGAKAQGWGGGEDVPTVLQQLWHHGHFSLPGAWLALGRSRRPTAPSVGLPDAENGAIWDWSVLLVSAQNHISVGKQMLRKKNHTDTSRK